MPTRAPAPHHQPSRRRSPRLCGDHGSASTELVIAMPALLLLVLASVHVGLWFHARHIVAAATEEGARTARHQGSTDAAGADTANEFLDQLGPNVVLDRHVTVSRTATTVTVTITGHAPAVIPGLFLDVDASTTSPIEQFRPN